MGRAAQWQGGRWAGVMAARHRRAVECSAARSPPSAASHCCRRGIRSRRLLAGAGQGRARERGGSRRRQLPALAAPEACRHMPGQAGAAGLPQQWGAGEASMGLTQPCSPAHWLPAKREPWRCCNQAGGHTQQGAAGELAHEALRGHSRSHTAVLAAAAAGGAGAGIGGDLPPWAGRWGRSKRRR